MDDLFRSMRISASGMKAQGTRLRVISENVANADSLATTPGAEPYRRKVITFKNEVDNKLGVDLVHVDKIEPQSGDLQKRFDPNHPAADQNGYVLMPNVNMLLEMADMREAQRSYEANLNVIKASKTMLRETIGILE
jgi:flagellar basal-body rod protein FlgC